jgi:hypothetical protein
MDHADFKRWSGCTRLYWPPCLSCRAMQPICTAPACTGAPHTHTRTYYALFTFLQCPHRFCSQARPHLCTACHAVWCTELHTLHPLAPPPHLLVFAVPASIVKPSSPAETSSMHCLSCPVMHRTAYTATTRTPRPLYSRRCSACIDCEAKLTRSNLI